MRDVAEFKIGTGKPVYDGSGKNRSFSQSWTWSGDFNRQSMYELFTQLMTISRKYQYGLWHGTDLDWIRVFAMVDELKREGVRIVYQGVEALPTAMGLPYSFWRGRICTMYHVAIFEDAMVEVEESRADTPCFP